MSALPGRSNSRSQLTRTLQSDRSHRLIALDIETYGPGYGRLGAVGVRTGNLVDGLTGGFGLSSTEWRSLPHVAERLAGLAELPAHTVLHGEAGDAERLMIRKTASVLERPENIGAILVHHNWNVDLARMATIAEEHADAAPARRAAIEARLAELIASRREIVLAQKVIRKKIEAISAPSLLRRRGSGATVRPLDGADALDPLRTQTLASAGDAGGRKTHSHSNCNGAKNSVTRHGGTSNSCNRSPWRRRNYGAQRAASGTPARIPSIP